MGNLIDGKWFTGKCVGVSYAELSEAHKYLTKKASEALSLAAGSTKDGTWGTTVKRIQVALDGETPPPSIPNGIPDHNLIETINQCATVERLLDALLWVQSAESGLQAFSTVDRCNPTTSSQKSEGQQDNDLILRSDSNSTERKLLLTWHVLADGAPPPPFSLLQLALCRRSPCPTSRGLCTFRPVL